MIGKTLAHYEILSEIGAGGMGEVYRARDTRLGREVAIKVLPRDLAATPEVRARFEREARLISSLNHPNICTVHDVGQEGEDFYLVMELVEGESLADRVSRGALPTTDLLRTGIQIADALDKAHRAGIVHRDLKPGNVMLAKSGAKLLDFGLARSGGAAVESASGSQSPTMSRPLTKEGTILGTFQYMAPEQLEGKEADARTDIWALGCVLYEMATGKRAFEGRSQASLISAIMSAEPTPIATISPLNPPALDRLVGACLAKEPDDRVQTAHDVKLQLQWIIEGGSQAGVAAPVAARRKQRERLSWIVTGLMTIVAVVATAAALQPKPEAKPVIFELTPPAQVSAIDFPRISPDGRLLAFNAADSLGVPSIWVREMNSLEARKLPGTTGATRPFWSPDSRFLAFFTRGKLYKIDVSGGPPLAICNAPGGADGSWGTRGVILFDGSTTDSVQSVPASGGVPTGATIIDRASGQAYTAWPEFLPDGQHFVYLAAYGGQPGVGAQELRVGSIDSKETMSLGPVGSRVEYASNHLLQVANGVLLAQKFDLGARKLVGDPFPVAQDVETGSPGAARFSASEEGTLVLRTSRGGGLERLVWFDRSGKGVGSVGEPGRYRGPALSPDGTHLAVAASDHEGKSDIWIYDLGRNLGSRFTFSADGAREPSWSPDGLRVAYSSGKSFTDIRAKDVGGRGVETVLHHSDALVAPAQWSSDGRWLPYLKLGVKQDFDIYALSFGDSIRSVPIRATALNEYHPSLSPDGSLLAYGSVESGSFEIYVQTFSGPGGKWRISAAGGVDPQWRGDGRELYYFSLDRKIMVVGVQPGSSPRFALPRELFSPPVTSVATQRNRYAVSKDGQRFLVITEGEDNAVGPTTVMLDWLGRLEKR